MAKKGGSMYYSDLIKGAGDVGASTIPLGVDTWTKAMEEIGDTYVAAVQKQKEEEEKKKKEEQLIEQRFNDSIVTPQLGQPFYDATKSVVATERQFAVDAHIENNPNNQSQSAFNISSINNANKNIASLLEEEADNAENISLNMSSTSKNLKTRMKAGEGVKLVKLTKDHDPRHGNVGEYVYIWTIDGKEYNVDDYKNLTLYNHASEDNYKSQIEDYETRGSDPTDGNKYSAGEEGKKELMAEIDDNTRNNILFENDPKNKQNALHHLLGNHSFQRHLRDHPAFNDIILDLNLPSGNEDGDGVWHTNISEEDVNMIIEAITDYGHEYYDEDISREVLRDYINKQTYATYMRNAQGTYDQAASSIEDQLVKGVHVNHLITDELPEQEEGSGDQFNFTGGYVYNNNGDSYNVDANRKRAVNNAINQGQPEFQGTWGYYLLEPGTGGPERWGGIYYRFDNKLAYENWEKSEKELKDLSTEELEKMNIERFMEEEVREMETGITNKRVTTTQSTATQSGKYD